MAKIPVTLRQIIEKALDDSKFDHDKAADDAVTTIKQKFAHLRRTLHGEINRLRNDNHEGQFSNDEVLDIFYIEIDNMIEGLDYGKKNLKDMSRET